MYPAQENIFVECEISKRKTKRVFDSMNTRLKMRESVRTSKRMSVYDLHSLSQKSSQSELKVSFLMPFKEHNIWKLIISGGIRIAAASLSI